MFLCLGKFLYLHFGRRYSSEAVTAKLISPILMPNNGSCKVLKIFCHIALLIVHFFIPCELINITSMYVYFPIILGEYWERIVLDVVARKAIFSHRVV